MEKILTVNEVAEILSVKPITVREMFREKRLRAFKVGKAWRTTETMLREDIDAMAQGAVGSNADAGETPSVSDEPTKKAPKKTKKPRSVESDTSSVDTADEAPKASEPESGPPQDTTDPRATAPAGKLDNHPDIAVDSGESEGAPMSEATRLMNQQEQISGAKQAETAIPSEPDAATQEATLESSAPAQEGDAAEEKRPKKKKKAPADQVQFDFDGIE